ncbi:angiopoietin-related protein 3 [Electrophorus electricus]|uniref:Fibrinogen C-terminal domain-containing protein n=1 Tax=Electrophorus electricus TaxID=8005 RepID=A0A4W4FET2_ELEEL|nr:angiopoietin-related protein 3 [Electrophorus electricus]
MKLACLILLGSLCTINAVPHLTRTVTETPLLRTPQPTEARSRFAMLDDVRLLANGLLQLGQSLREFVHKTKAQINDIFQKLNIFDRSFYQLSLVTSEIKEEEEELKKTTTFLKANNEEIRNLSMEIHSKVNSILQERSQLQTKVGSLEERLKGLSHTMVPPEQLQEISTLKGVIDTQEKTIKDLLEAVREQHEQLNSQKIKIKSLEEKLGSDSFQETAEKSTNSSPEQPNVLEYLTSNSTNSTMDTNDFPSDCSEIFRRGQTNSGIYSIKPNQSEPFNVFCDMSSDGVATIIQRRVDGSLDFDQNWDKYELGFGSLEKEFWLGLAKIYSIASQGEYILNIQLEDWKEERRFVEYMFTLDGPASHYTIHLTLLSGNVPDAMSNHTGMFSTNNKDNNQHKDSNCAPNYTGGWWFNACGDTNLNGPYTWMRSRSRTLRRKGIYWRPGRRSSYTLRSTKISIRPSS